MMIEQATVLHYHNGVALIQCHAKAGCGGCAANSCGVKSLSALAGEKVAPQFELAVPSVLNAGDRIEIGMSERNLLRSVWLLYGLPLLVLVASALLLSLWIENELWVALGILLCTLASFRAIHQQVRNKPQKAFEPVFIRQI